MLKKKNVHVWKYIFLLIYVCEINKKKKLFCCTVDFQALF